MGRASKRQRPGKETTMDEVPQDILTDITARMPTRAVRAAKAASRAFREHLPWCDERLGIAYYATTRTPAYLTLLRTFRDGGVSCTLLVRDGEGNMHTDMSITTPGHFRLEHVAPNGLVWLSATERPCSDKKVGKGLARECEIRASLSDNKRRQCNGEGCYDSCEWSSFVVNPASRSMVAVPLPLISRPQDYGRCMSFDPATSTCTLVQVRLGRVYSDLDIDAGDEYHCFGSLDIGFVDVCRVELASGSTPQWKTVPIPSPTRSCIVDLEGFLLPHGNIRVVCSANYFFWAQESLKKAKFKLWILNSLDLSLDSLNFPNCRFRNCKCCSGFKDYSEGNWILWEVAGQVILIHTGDHRKANHCWKLARAEERWEWQYMENGPPALFLLSKACGWDLFRQPFKYAAFGENTVAVLEGIKKILEFNSGGETVRKIRMQKLEMLLKSQAGGGTGLIPMKAGSLDVEDHDLPMSDLKVVGVWTFEDNNIAWPAPHKDLNTNLILTSGQLV